MTAYPNRPRHRRAAAYLSHRWGWPLGVLLWVVALSAPAHAQFRRATSPVAPPASSLAAPDDALASTLNPAALPYLAGWSIVYLHTDADPSLRLAERGDTLAAAIPLPFGFGIGAQIDGVYPTPAAIAAGAMERTSLSLALGYAPSDVLSLGAAARVFFSGDDRMAGLFAVDAALTWRPLPYVSASFIGRDLAGPGFQSGGGRVPRSFVLAFGIRPTGTRTLTFDLSGAVDDEGRVGARLAGELEVPFVGRLLAAAEADRVGDARPDVRITAGVAVDFDRIGVGGGVLLGDGFDTGPGLFVSARLEEASRPGIPSGDVIADVRVEGVGARGLLSLVARLDRALRDPRVRGVVLRMRGSGMGLAYAQELRLLISALAEAGKPTVCVLGDASGSELYACGGARSVLIDPAGGVRLYGPSTEVLHLGDLLREIDVRADFVRIGRYKSAIEQYQDRSMSEAAREERETLLDDVFARMVSDLSRDLEMPEARIRELVDEGPYVSQGALRAGLVDALADEYDMSEALEEAFEGGYALERREPAHLRARWGHAPRVGVVVVDGEMVDGENVDIPLLEIHATGGRTAVSAIESMAADPAIAAIVVRIDSPGGSVLAADQIWRAIRRARRHKPVIASMGAVAASGGYYIASACDEIWADPATVTGSIGVWFGKIDFAPLAERFGAHTEFLGRGERAGAESLFRPFTPDERSVLSRMVRHWYRAFLGRVAEGRDMRIREVDALARGRIWTGDRALEVGLVDRLGGFHSALQHARLLGGLPDDAGFEVRPGRPVTLLDYVLGETALGSASATADAGEVLGTLAPELRSALRTIWSVRAVGSERPAALLEWQPGF